MSGWGTIEIDGQSRRYGIPDPDGWIKLSDAKNTKLGLLTDRGLKRFAYTYDFGDNWEHTLMIEAIGDADAGLEYPRVVDGARRAPPEYLASRSSSRPWPSSDIPNASG